MLRFAALAGAAHQADCRSIGDEVLLHLQARLSQAEDRLAKLLAMAYSRDALISCRTVCCHVLQDLLEVLVKGAVEIVARYLGVTKSAVYSYIKEARAHQTEVAGW